MGPRRRETRAVRSHGARLPPVDPDAQSRRVQRSDPYGQAPRRFLPVALGLYRTFGEEFAVQGRTGRYRPGVRRRLPGRRDEDGALLVAVGPESCGLRETRIYRILPQPTPGVADRLRRRVRGVVRRGQWRGRLVRRRQPDAHDRPQHLLRLAGDVADRPGIAARCGDVLGRRTGRALGRQ